MVAKIDKKIEQTLKYLKENSKEKMFSLDNFEYVKCSGYKTDNTFPEKGWAPLGKDEWNFCMNLAPWEILLAKRRGCNGTI